MLMWVWPVVGLVLASFAGALAGPVGVVLATLVGAAVLVLGLEKNLLSARARLVTLLVVVLVTGTVLVAQRAGWEPLRRPGDHPAARNQQTAAQVSTYVDKRIGAKELRRGDLPRQRLRGAVLDDLPLDRVDLHDLDAAGASLRRTRLRDADLRDAVLRGADLRDADLRGACLDRADLTGALVQGTLIDGAHLTGAILPALPPTDRAWQAATVSPCPR